MGQPFPLQQTQQPLQQPLQQTPQQQALQQPVPQGRDAPSSQPRPPLHTQPTRPTLQAHQQALQQQPVQQQIQMQHIQHIQQMQQMQIMASSGIQGLQMQQHPVMPPMTGHQQLPRRTPALVRPRRPASAPRSQSKSAMSNRGGRGFRDRVGSQGRKLRPQSAHSPRSHFQLTQQHVAQKQGQGMVGVSPWGQTPRDAGGLTGQGGTRRYALK
jgi:hypothetical protein